MQEGGSQVMPAARKPKGASGDSVMNDNIYQRIEDSARFRELVEKRQRFATILSVIMLAVYISFILLIALRLAGWVRRCMREPALPGVFRLGSA